MSACSIEDFNARETADAMSLLYKKTVAGDPGSSGAAQELFGVLNYVNDGHICGITTEKMVNEVFNDLSGPLAGAAQIKFVDKPGYPHLEDVHSQPQIAIPGLDWGKLSQGK